MVPWKLVDWFVTKRNLPLGLRNGTFELTPPNEKGEPGMALNAPLGAMLKTFTRVGPKLKFAVKSCVLAQLMSIPPTEALNDPPPAWNGEPGTAVKAPFPPMLNIATLPPPALKAKLGGKAADRNRLSGETLIPSMPPVDPTEKGEPATGVSEPLDAMLNAEIVSELSFEQNKNLLVGVTPRECPKKTLFPPARNGDPGTGVRNPVTGLIEKPLMVLLPLLLAYKNFPAVETVTRLAA